MTQQADDSTPNPVGNPLLDQLEIEFSDDLKIHLDETGERHRDEEREHHELIEHDYENPTTGFEFDYLQQCYADGSLTFVGNVPEDMMSRIDGILRASPYLAPKVARDIFAAPPPSGE